MCDYFGIVMVSLLREATFAQAFPPNELAVYYTQTNNIVKDILKNVRYISLITINIAS